MAFSQLSLFDPMVLVQYVFRLVLTATSVVHEGNDSDQHQD